MKLTLTLLLTLFATTPALANKNPRAGLQGYLRYRLR
jgi:hypothetical protein